MVVNKYISGVNKLYAETKRDGLNDDHFFSLLESYDSTLGMYRFIKNYQGKLKRKNQPIINNFRFADEREWRYVPDTPGLEFPFAPKEFFDTEEKKAELNLKVSHLKLSFQADFNVFLNVVKPDITIISATRLQWCRISMTSKSGKAEVIITTGKKSYRAITA